MKALISTAHRHGRSLRILQASQDVNELQKCLLYEKLATFYNGTSRLTGKSVALWGLSFKPGTDDLREAPSLELIRRLLAAGARVRAYDPVASNRARSLLLAEHGATTCDAYLFIASSAHEAVEHADVLVVMTEWHEFRFPDFDKLARMLRSRAIFDARNIYDYRAVIAAGLYYEGIGRYVEQRRVDEAR